MKTRILYRRPKLGGGKSELYARAYLPDEIDPEDRGVTKDHRVARFIPARTQHYRRLGDDPKSHDAIELGSYRYRASWTRPLDDAVILSDEDLKTLDELDLEIESLRTCRRRFMELAASRSRGLRIDDLTDEEGNSK
jgi:hypothetical protein